MSVIGILGGGWLGSALAEKALEKGHLVKITTTTAQKRNSFVQKGFNTHLLKVNETDIEGELEFFKDIDFLVITIPPGLRKNPERNYVSLMEQIILKIELFEIKKVLFTSSTGVYGFQEGVISEASALLGTTSSAQQIIEVEQKLLKRKKFESSIIRLGGLMGPDRHPITTLSGKKNLPNPLSPINFIHQKDAVAIILQVLENGNGNQVYNAVSPFHPSRKEYYEQMAKIAQLSPPTFEKTGAKRGIISAEKIVNELNYQFMVKNLLILF